MTQPFHPDQQPHEPNRPNKGPLAGYWRPYEPGHPTHSLVFGARYIFGTLFDRDKKFEHNVSVALKLVTIELVPHEERSIDDNLSIVRYPNNAGCQWTADVHLRVSNDEQVLLSTVSVTQEGPLVAGFMYDADIGKFHKDPEAVLRTAEYVADQLAP